MSHACIDTSIWTLPVTGSSKFSVLEYLVLRFVNIFHLTDFSVDKIWMAVKKVKFNELLSTACGDDGIYMNSARERIMKSVEQELEINSTDQSFEKKTSKDLNTAAEFFIRLSAYFYFKILFYIMG